VFNTRIIRYTEMRVCHSTALDCPHGYGRLHPAIAWEEWVAWKWYLGGFLDRLMNWYYGIPIVRRLVQATWTAHIEMIRGPWSPIRGETLEIPWERAPHPEDRWLERGQYERSVRE
jgi:hypothetical protein